MPHAAPNNADPIIIFGVKSEDPDTRISLPLTEFDLPEIKILKLKKFTRNTAPKVNSNVGFQFDLNINKLPTMLYLFIPETTKPNPKRAPQTTMPKYLYLPLISA